MLIFAILCLIAATGVGFAFFKARSGSNKALPGADKLRALQRANEEEATESSPIENMKPGGVLQLQNVGLRSETIDAQVTACHLHKEGSARWTELETDTANGKVFITVQRDDELEVSVSLAELKIEDLGLSSAQLSSEEGAGESLHYEGTSFELAASGRAQYCPQGNELSAESYQYWEYCSAEDDFQTLTVVRWQDGSAEAFYGVAVEVDNVTVYSTS